MTTRTLIRLPVNSRTVSAALCLGLSAALIGNVIVNESTAAAPDVPPPVLTGGRVGMADLDRADGIMDRMLTVAEESGRDLMKSSQVLNDGFYTKEPTPGACVDSEDQRYDHASNDKKNAAQCAQYCARHLLYYEHRGFNYNPAIKDCQCLFDDHKIPRPVQKKSKYVEILPHGTGRVRGTDDSGEWANYECYKKNQDAIGSPLDNYVEKRCDLDDSEVLDFVAFNAFEPEPCAALCGRFSMLKTHRGFSVTIEGHCRCLFKEGEVPTERKLSNSGADRWDGGYTFQERFDMYITPADTKCFDTVDTMGSVPKANRLAPPSNNHVFINEFHFRNFQTNEPFVRIVGPKGSSAANFVLVSYQGRDGTAFLQTPLTGTFESNDSSAFGSIKVDLPKSAVRNGKMGADGIALANSQTGECLQFISYASEVEYQRSFQAGTGLCAGEASVPLPVGVTEPRDLPLGSSLQLSGVGNKYDDFSWTGPADAATGTANAGQTLTAI
eukprot:CAMPEP_0113550790 /NCGR_PEP_ID=MMETSP0015_2-20120614/14173_1 /TAXON_ID=2838 /ORGANISM="Odontella" /LENGTH=497 /DNA_ID=CAMNT_0000451627 /DNA_START=94 /DNA_END=1587 /DNA_ORIENTATION=- /assembly_acc=CAM_ASM_000160